MLTRKQIEELGAVSAPHCVSLYLPTHRAGSETHQGPIRLKNLLTAGEHQLVARGLRATVARDLLAPARSLLADEDFWMHQADGLALFLSSDSTMQTFRLPLQVGEHVYVSDRFHVKPLLPLLNDNGRFYVLAISLNSVRFFEAGPDTIRERALRGVPHSLEEAVGSDWEEDSLQFHTGTGGSQAATGARRAMFHGHGAPADDEKTEIPKFLRRVDDGVCALLGGDRAPIVLAGVENITATYRLLTKAPHVLAVGLDGNPDQASAADLHHRALRVVEPGLTAEIAEAAERYDTLAETGRAESDLASVLRAAFERRVDTLFVAPDEERWGTFDESSWTAEVHEERQAGDRDLVDVAAVQCLRSGADVYAVPPERIPGHNAVAAILRY